MPSPSRRLLLRLVAGLTLVAAGAVAAFGPSACNDDPAPAHRGLLGTWEMTQQAGGRTGTTAMTFNEDGSYTIVVDAGSPMTQSGSWTVTGDRLTMTPPDCASRPAGTCPAIYTWKVDGPTLTLSTTPPAGGAPVTLSLSRK
jgi:hypothetical protein